ncbi:MAG: cupredoxin domain-containing protein [Actinomycetota bacterium]
MRRLIRALALASAAAAIVALGGCVDPKPSTPTPEDLRAIDLSPDHTITVDEDGFDPATLEVRSGEVVLLVNDGDDLHSFTAEERFDTGRMEPGEETTLLLTEPGEIPYRDLESDAAGVLTILPAEDG